MSVFTKYTVLSRNSAIYVFGENEINLIAKVIFFMFAYFLEICYKAITGFSFQTTKYL